MNLIRNAIIKYPEICRVKRIYSDGDITERKRGGHRMTTPVGA
jgi:hypothetical protein